MRNFFGVLIAIPLFLIFMIFAGISGCAEQNEQINSKKEYGESTIVIRYYTHVEYDELGNPDYDHGVIRFDRVSKKGDSIQIPTKEGYTFGGLYSDPLFSQNAWVVDTEGNFVRTLTDADDGMLLYPLFIQN